MTRLTCGYTADTDVADCHRGFLGTALAHDRLEGTGFFQNLNIIADPDDPHDLFKILTRAGTLSTGV